MYSPQGQILLLRAQTFQGSAQLQVDFLLINRTHVTVDYGTKILEALSARVVRRD